MKLHFRYASVVNLVFIFLPCLSIAQSYQYALDLNQVEKDRLWVEVVLPPQREESVLFHFPRTIPGTYSRQDYGRYISKLEALDAEGNPLPVKKKGKNSYLLQDARQTKKLRYRVSDTFDAKTRQDKVFEPAGTNIEAGQCFVLNAGGFFGFLDGQEGLPFELSINKPADLYGSTALATTRYQPEQQTFIAKNYQALQDAPIMFAPADTVSFYLANARIE
ncbi:MAG: peptidase M61, partial [Bacteroidota bacterium]